MHKESALTQQKKNPTLCAFSFSGHVPQPSTSVAKK